MLWSVLSYLINSIVSWFINKIIGLGSIRIWVGKMLHLDPDLILPDPQNWHYVRPQ